MSKETIETTKSVAVSGGNARIKSNESKSNQIHVVAIGASAGGLESIERFFENIDEDTGAAFVVIQHLSPDFKSFMPEILSKKTRLQVLTATDQMPIHPNIIYLMPPRMSLFIENSILYLSDLKRTRTPNKSINLFFESLANDFGERATAVVLSGTGTDGADGVRCIHEAGGKVYVESPASAKFDGMPAAALSQRVHDGEGTPFEIAGQIFGKDVSDFRSSTMVLKKELDGSDERVSIFKAIENRYGVDFARYKIATVNRRIDRRITELNVKSIEAYWEYIQNNQDEVTTLYYEMLIGVTKFFRDPEAFELIKEEVRRIVESKDAGEEVRVWSAGCASGEETYSLAMLFSDEIRRSGKSLHLKVFATDIDDEILGRATNGLYRKDQMADIPEKFVTRYFNETSDRFKVSSALRSRVVFARHNIMNDPPFAKLDMITCRNLLIYLDNNTQRQVLSLFYFSLNPNGTLFLGPSESLGKYEAGYDTTDSKWKIFSKSVNSLPAVGTVLPARKIEREFPVVVNSSQRPLDFASTTAQKISSEVAYQALLEQFVPSGLLINESQELLHAYGETPFTLKFKPGKVSNNLRSFLDENLCTAVSVCIQRAKRERVSVEYAKFVVVENDKKRHIDFKVTPIVQKSAQQVSYFLITFGEKDAPELGGTTTNVVVEKSLNLEQVSVLEEELNNTKLHLKSTIEELESTNEELQSTNEELLASNEELQSTNEELHSVNEELYTVNAEFQSKITELNQLSMDEEHLFHSTGVGTIFIDQQRRIRKFTPTAAELFNLLAQDQGRPFDHVTHLFEGVNFNQLVEQCISSEEVVEAEVTTRSGEPHIIKIVPYQNDREEPDGVVISFVSMRSVKNAEQLYRDMFQASPVGIVGLTPDLKIISLNASLKELIGYSDKDLLGQSLERLFPVSQVGDASQIIRSFIQGSGKPRKREQIASTVIRQDGMEVPVEISVSSVPTETGTVVHLYVTDMTDRQHYLDAVESSRDTLEALVEARTAELGVRTAEYQDLYENAPDMYASISPLNASIIKCNNRLALKTGYSKSELVGMKVFNLYHPDSHADAQDSFEQFVENGFVASRQLLLKSKDGKRIPVLLNVDAVRDRHGNITQSRSTWVDISDVEMLKNENKTFVLATQGSEIGIWDWDFVSGEQIWSAKFHELLGYPDSDQQLLSFDKPGIVHADDRDSLAALFKIHFADEKDFSIEVRLQVFNNSYRWFHLQGKAVRDASGKVVRMVGSARDVHSAREAQDQLRSQEIELKEINEQLARSNDHLEQFAYITSHDLKAPLRGITTLVTFMEEDLEDVLDEGSSEATAIQGNLVRLSLQATRMEGLISGVLDYSRVDSVGATYADVDVREVLSDVAADQHLTIGSELHVPNGLPVLRTDPIMFGQVFGNLISNAAKFHLNPDELKIDIGYECDDEYHTFSVSDNGPGIRPEFHLRIFDMFQTLQSKDSYESTGIGLTLVKRIVEKFGGRVFVESVEGQGARFSFTWPVAMQDPVI